MKKTKEILLLLVLFIVSLILYVVLCCPSPFISRSEFVFEGGLVYLKMFLKDKTFFMLIINTFRKPFVSSVVLIPIACLILKNRIKFTRKSFYLTAFVVSFMISIVYLITNNADGNLLGYIFFPMSVSFLCLIIFLILEMIDDIVKKVWKKRSN